MQIKGFILPGKTQNENVVYFETIMLSVRTGIPLKNEFYNHFKKKTVFAPIILLLGFIILVLIIMFLSSYFLIYWL